MLWGAGVRWKMQAEERAYEIHVHPSCPLAGAEFLYEARNSSLNFD